LAGEAVTAVEISAEEEAADRRYRASMIPIRFGDDPPAGLVTVVVEVGERSDAERALRIARERLSLVLEGTGVAIYEWDVAGDTLRWSPDLGLLWGRERGWRPSGYGEFLATIHPADRAVLEASVEDAVHHGRPYELEFRVLWPEGPGRWMHTRTFVERDADGRPATLVGLVSDIHARRVRELASEFLSRASLALSRSLDVGVTLAQVAELAVPELAEWCAVQVVTPGGRLDTVAIAHVDPGKVELALELERRYPAALDAPTGAPAVVRTGRAELYPVITAAEVEAAAVDEEHLRLVRELRMQSAMVVPIVARDTPLGVISFVAGPGDPTYGTADLELAEELGRRVGLALDNARTHERLAEVQAVTDVALSHLERDDLVAELLRRVRDLLGGDFAVLLLLDAEGRNLRVRSAIGLEEEVTADVAVPLGRGVAGSIAARARPRVIDDLRQVDARSPYLRERARSLVGVPLMVEGRVLGVMHVSSERVRAFDADDVELLQLVAERAARAIAHAAIYEETRATAIALQRALLPERLPRIPGATVAARYLPGQRTLEVGGDWYDVLPLRDGRYALVVGDVMGRGVQAAAVMGQLRAALRAYLHSTAEPAAALAQLDALADDLEAVSFATLMIAAYDPAAGGFELASAGHPPPVARDAGGHARLVEGATGPPLGAGTPERRSHAGVLPPGGMLAGYTDGLLEVRGEDIDARLELLRATVASAPDDADAAAEHLLRTMLGEPGAAGDDTALLLLRRAGADES
ncbi:MAG TPA: SpoIIE family protein phosphatase, partial [Solirubrobacteraceae bacterium]|nr:SpoIIE family protein phosphatase [Solirubrobacteraceae bacterium]